VQRRFKLTHASSPPLPPPPCFLIALQVPADIAFLVIAILSHGAWIFRWATAASGLSMALAALMALNAAVMQVGTLGLIDLTDCLMKCAKVWIALAGLACSVWWVAGFVSGAWLQQPAHGSCCGVAGASLLDARFHNCTALLGSAPPPACRRWLCCSRAPTSAGASSCAC
jgi:hypothetical protein